MGSLKVLGLTATPFAKGLSKLYTNLVNVTTTDKLIEDGYLVPLKMYAAIAPDMEGAKVVAGEWADKDIEKRGLEIVGDIVKEWQDKTAQHFGGPVKTIVFSATVDHGAELCRKFNEAGHRFEQISYKDSNEERRRELIAEFRKPDSTIVGLVSCEVFTKGFDVPDVRCGISARPYRKSFSSHIQQLGRVLRPSAGKDFALWLCHSGNVLRFNADTVDLFANGVSGLDDGKLEAKARKEPDQDEKDLIKCAGCGYVLPPRAVVCPGKHAFLARREDVWSQLVSLGLERKKGDVEAAQRFAQAQYRTIYGDFARRTVVNTEPMPPAHELRSLVQHNIIRWAKSRPHA
jgi:superfamily II DNA or RNA helicase